SGLLLRIGFPQGCPVQLDPFQFRNHEYPLKKQPAENFDESKKLTVDSSSKLWAQTSRLPPIRCATLMMTTIPYSSAAPTASVPRCASAPRASCLNSASLPDLRKSVNHLSRLCMTGFLD